MVDRRAVGAARGPGANRSRVIGGKTPTPARRAHRPRASATERDRIPKLVVQGVDHNAERDVALELGGAPVERLLSPDAELRQQPGLADPRLANQLNGPRLAGIPPRSSPRSISASSPARSTSTPDRCRALVLIVVPRREPTPSPHGTQARHGENRGL
jgi:hypothetical protein